AIMRSGVFARDGKSVLLPDNANLALWDLTTGKDSRPFQSSPGAVSWVEFSPDGRFLKVEAFGAVLIWDTVAGGEPLRFENSARDCVVFSPDGRYALDSVGTDANFWDLWTKTVAVTLKGEAIGATRLEDMVRSLAFSADGRYAITGHGATGYLWEIST